MTRTLASVLFGLSVMAMVMASPLPGADGPGEKGRKQSFEATHTERVPFLPGGTIHIANSYGYLTVERLGDEPEVEVTVTEVNRPLLRTR